MNNLKKLRNEKHMSQMDLANELDIPQSTYQQYEAGIHEPGFDMLKTLADYFHVSVDYLMGHTPVRSSLTDEDIELAALIREIKDMELKRSLLCIVKELIDKSV